MKQKFKTVAGTFDILPEESWKWQFVESVIHRVLQAHNYKEIRTPVFEQTELFSRSVGVETDIVSKEMYTFEDRRKRSLTLKPELTAPVIRAFIQHRMDQFSPLTKLYYIDSLFRHEKHQKGRQRQFHQFGFESIGSPHPEADAEIIAIIYEVYNYFYLKNIRIQINSVGSKESRTIYVNKLKSALNPYVSDLCEICQTRFERNTLRLFDCKNESCQAILDEHAPSILDFLNAEDLKHFEDLQEYLDYLHIPFDVNHRLVRGLDYYSRTTFEVNSPDLGAQDALCGGGRYDYLVEELGGKPTPAVGVAAGMERLMLVLDTMGFFKDPPRTPDVFIVMMGKETIPYGLRIYQELSSSGISCDMDFLRRSLKAQMREANRQKARFALIVGEQELKNNRVSVKDLDTGEQYMIDYTDITDWLRHFPRKTGK